MYGCATKGKCVELVNGMRNFSHLSRSNLSFKCDGKVSVTQRDGTFCSWIKWPGSTSKDWIFQCCPPGRSISLEHSNDPSNIKQIHPFHPIRAIQSRESGKVYDSRSSPPQHQYRYTAKRTSKRKEAIWTAKWWKKKFIKRKPNFLMRAPLCVEFSTEATLTKLMNSPSSPWNTMNEMKRRENKNRTNRKKRKKQKEKKKILRKIRRSGHKKQKI